MRKILIRVFRKFRFLFKNGLLERILLKFTIGKKGDHILNYLHPCNYHYPRNTIRKIERDGIKMELDISDYNQHMAYWGFKWHNVLQECLNYLKPDDIVFDIGTNFGDYLLHFGKKVSQGMVYGFEPFPNTYRVCLKEVNLNPSLPIKLECLGLGDKEGEFDMYMFNENSGENRILPLGELDSTSHKTITVNVTTIDTYCLKNSIEKVDFIKLDVEGFEWNVIKGARNIIEKCKPFLCIEIDEKNLNKHQAGFADILKFLTERDYYFIHSITKQRILKAEALRNTDVFAIPFDLLSKEVAIK